tara:strand:+ start:5764 stop:6126 length:363 start_codon:yes stop_codon:yes gene_type:complete
MTCGLHSKFDRAVDALKDALHEAIDTKDFDRGTLSEVWRHYQGLQTISEGLPEHKEHDKITFGNDTTFNLDDDGLSIGNGEIDLNFNLDADAVGAADTVPVNFGGSGLVGGAGSDVITFS